MVNFEALIFHGYCMVGKFCVVQILWGHLIHKKLLYVTKLMYPDKVKMKFQGQ